MVWHFNAAEASKYTQKENAYQIVTLGTDGRVLIWNWRNLDAPVYAYELVHKRPDPKNPRQVLWGGTAMSFHPYTALTDNRVRDRDRPPPAVFAAYQAANHLGTVIGAMSPCMALACVSPTIFAREEPGPRLWSRRGANEDDVGA